MKPEMMSRIRRLLSPEMKNRITACWPYRLYTRLGLSRKRIRFSVELTTRCNLNCAMCTRSALVRGGGLMVGEMSDEVVDRVIDEMKKFVKMGYEVEFAPMGLGEPLVYSKLVKLLRRIRSVSPRIKIVLVTNGILLNTKVSRELVELGVDEISISLNVKSKSDYKKYLGTDNYEKVIKNISELIAIRNKLEKSQVAVFVQYLKYHQEDFSGEIERWGKIMSFGDKCYVHPIVNQAGFNKSGADIGDSDSFPCSSPLSRVAIKINGDIYPCDPCFYGGSEKIVDLYLGNIIKDGVWKMFSNKKSKNYKIVEEMKTGNYENLLTCRKCNTYKLSVNSFFKNPVNKKWM